MANRLLDVSFCCSRSRGLAGGGGLGIGGQGLKAVELGGFLVHPVVVCVTRLVCQELEEAPTLIELETEGTLAKQWQKQHKQLRDRHDLHGLERWSLRHRVGGVAPTNLRVRDAIDLAWQLEQRKAIIETREPNLNLVLDTSQAMSRMPVTVGRVRSIVRNSNFFSYALQRLIHPEEHLKLMGCPRPLDIASVVQSQHRLRDLTGEAMSSPCAGGVLACLLANISPEGLWAEQ